MSQRDFKSRFRWIALNAALFLGVAAIAYRLEGWRAASPFVGMFAIAVAWVLVRRPTSSHP
jgi:hypothetical protein